MIRRVRMGRRAEASLDRLPHHILRKLLGWVDAVETEGLEEVRRLPGFHDEPLKGSWQGYRSIRLNRAYRAIYRMAADHATEIVVIEEVNRHEY